MGEMVLELENICKSLDGITVLDSVNIQVKEGEFIGIVGTNGAGKTVLSDILTGARKADSGTIRLYGEECVIQSPAHARKLGIYAMNQTVTLVDKLTIAENLSIEQKQDRYLGFISWKKRISRTQGLLDKLGIAFSVTEQVQYLNQEQKRLIELARLYAGHPKIAVFDDCFVSLSPNNLKLMEQVMEWLLEMGTTILYFSHRVEPIFKRCDSVVVVRDSKISGVLSRNEYSQKAAFDVILKEQGHFVYPKLPGKKGKNVLEVQNLSTESGLKEISFELKKGEILGIAGDMDSGKHELARALFGAEALTGGSIFVRGEKLIPSPGNAITHHIGYLPEDTESEGLLPDFSIESNIAVSKLMKNNFWYQTEPSEHKEVAKDYIRRLHINCVSSSQKVAFLSIGNQQKVNIAKWLQANCSILILEEPFKGIDPGNLVDLYNYICQLVIKGVSVILMSSNYDELIGLSDRILIMKKGKKEKIVSSAQCNVKDLMEYIY